MNEAPLIEARVRRPRRAEKVSGGPVAAAYLILLAVVAATAPFIAPYGYNEQDYTMILQGISESHWLGTDDLGRDVLTRLIHGTQASIMAAVIAISIALLIGIPAGLVSGFLGGWVDSVMMRILDTLLAFPTVVLAIAITATLGTGIVNAMVAVGIVLAPSFGRLMRAQVMQIRGRLYVDASRTFGARTPWLLLRHIIPNASQPIIVMTAHMLGVALLVEASLSFLGLGIPPPQPSWGGMLREASRVSTGLDIQILAPGLAIAITLLVVAILGDWLRDRLDPRMISSRRS
ncbi:ABC transporter permease [Blastococcus sp. SYSU DS1024]